VRSAHDINPVHLASEAPSPSLYRELPHEDSSVRTRSWQDNTRGSLRSAIPTRDLLSTASKRQTRHQPEKKNHFGGAGTVHTRESIAQQYTKRTKGRKKKEDAAMAITARNRTGNAKAKKGCRTVSYSRARSPPGAEKRRENRLSGRCWHATLHASRPPETPVGPAGGGGSMHTCRATKPDSITAPGGLHANRSLPKLNRRDHRSEDRNNSGRRKRFDFSGACRHGARP